MWTKTALVDGVTGILRPSVVSERESEESLPHCALNLQLES